MKMFYVLRFSQDKCIVTIYFSITIFGALVQKVHLIYETTSTLFDSCQNVTEIFRFNNLTFFAFISLDLNVLKHVLNNGCKMVEIKVSNRPNGPAYTSSTL